MDVIDTEVVGVKILKPQVFGDNRGWFMESWSKKKMEDAGLFSSSLPYFLLNETSCLYNLFLFEENLFTLSLNSSI